MNNEETIPKVILRVFSKDNPNGGGLVAEFESIPMALFEPKPKGLFWGNRFFVFVKVRGNGDMIYVEDMAYWLIDGLTAKWLDKDGSKKV